MTVKELIEKLKEFDENLEVIADTQDWAVYNIERVQKEERKKKDWTPVYLIRIS